MSTVTRPKSFAKQRAERLATLEAQYADGVKADKAERAVAAENRRQAAAIAELQRNGVEVPDDTDSLVDRIHDRPGRPAKAWEPVQPVARRTVEFFSRPDAKPMQQADICNVQILSQAGADAIIKRARETRPELLKSILDTLILDWHTLLNLNEVYTLTAYAMRKVERGES